MDDVVPHEIGQHGEVAQRCCSDALQMIASVLPFSERHECMTTHRRRHAFHQAIVQHGRDETCSMSGDGTAILRARVRNSNKRVDDVDADLVVG